MSENKYYNLIMAKFMFTGFLQELLNNSVWFVFCFVGFCVQQRTPNQCDLKKELNPW